MGIRYFDGDETAPPPLLRVVRKPDPSEAESLVPELVPVPGVHSDPEEDATDALENLLSPLYEQAFGRPWTTEHRLHLRQAVSFIVMAAAQW